LSKVIHQLLIAGDTSVPEEWDATGGVEVKGKGVMETYLWNEEASPKPAGIATAEGGIAGALPRPSSRRPELPGGRQSRSNLGRPERYVRLPSQPEEGGSVMAPTSEDGGQAASGGIALLASGGPMTMGGTAKNSEWLDKAFEDAFQRNPPFCPTGR
jgi:hypothetical protein